MRDPRLGDMIILSSVLHLVILVAVIIVPKLFFSKKIFYSPVYTVNLVSPFEKKGPLPSPETVSVEQKERPKEISPDVTPLTKEGITRLKDAIKRLEALKKIREKQRVSTPSAGERPQSGKSDMESPGTRPSGVATRELLDLKYRLYYNMIWEKIRDSWVLPEGVTKGKNLEAIVALRIKRDGTIEKFWIEKGSGNVYFDQSTIRAINKANPLPPLPEEFREDIFEVGVRFYP